MTKTKAMATKRRATTSSMATRKTPPLVPLSDSLPVMLLLNMTSSRFIFFLSFCLVTQKILLCRDFKKRKFVHLTGEGVVR